MAESDGGADGAHDQGEDGIARLRDTGHGSGPVIKQASIYDPVAPDPGLRVLVMRYWPRGVKKERVDVWLKDAAPSVALLKAYRHEDLPWSEFERRYRAEIKEERPAVLDELRALERVHGTLTLLCTERVGHCHRTLLRELISLGS